MKSFKKIALAMVAAMTTATIVATPASAAPMSLVVAKGSGTNASPTWTAVTAASTPNGLSTTAPVALTVPADNSVDAADVLKFTATVDAGTSVTVTAANAVLITAHATSTAPVTSLATVATAGTATADVVFYVYTKTTAIGTVAIANGGTSATYYVQGTVGGVSAIAVTGVDTAAAGTQNTYTVSATDVFGNKVTGVELTATVANGTVDTATAVTGSGLTDFGSKDFKVTVPASGTTTVIFAVNTTAMAAATPAKPVQAAITGFVTPVLTSAKSIAVRDLAAELAAKNAELVTANTALAAEKAGRAADKAAADKALADAIAKAATDAATAKAAADLAKATYIKEYNALATKWNKKFPKLKVTLKK
jgi:hypothetical protein